MNFDDCDSLSSPVCGQYSKLYIDSQTLKPYYQKTDKTKVFIHASNNAWFVSDEKNVTFAIALESSPCPYDLTSWNVYADNQVPKSCTILFIKYHFEIQFFLVEK